MPDPIITDTSGITEGDGHFLHEHPDIMSNPAAKNALAKYTNAKDAMMGGVNAMALVGKPHINIPADDADDTKKAEFKAALRKHTGAPDNVEGYKITRPDGSNDTNYNTALEAAFLAHALNTGMTQEMVGGEDGKGGSYGLALQMIKAINTRDTDADKADIDKAVLKLTADLGGETKLKEGMELKSRLLATYANAETAELFDNRRIVNKDGKDTQHNGTVFGNHAGLNLFLIKVANVMVKEGRTLLASGQTEAKTAGTLRYKGMEDRAAQSKG